jgi:signal peptidase I
MMRSTRASLLLLAAALTLTGCDKIRDGLPWKRFSIASVSMEPTLRKGSYVTGDSVDAGEVARGDILFVRSGGVDYVARLAGLPGDEIAMVNGRVVLNGKPIRQRVVGRWTISDARPGPQATILAERFPGERRAHRVLDDGITVGDNSAPVTLGADEYFVLGDNRDHAADSRFGGGGFGIGVVSSSDIQRRLNAD